MRCIIKHSLPGRLRFQLPSPLGERDAVALEEMFLELPMMSRATAYPRAASLAVEFDPTDFARQAVVRRMARLKAEDLAAWQPADPLALAPRARHLYAELANATAWFVIRLLMPNPLKTLW